MKLSLNNFLYDIKQIVTGKTGAYSTISPGGTAMAADGGIKHDVPIPLTVLAATPGTAPAITDNTGGTASATFASMAPNALITDSTGGAASATFAAITAPAANATTSLTADMTAVKNALAQTALELNAVRTTIIAVQNAAAEVAKVFNAQSSQLGDSSSVQAIVVPSGTNASVGILSLPVPRDYDEATDTYAIKVWIVLANADAAITLTGTPTTLVGSTFTTGTAVSAVLPFKTAAQALSTSVQALDINLSGLGLKRDTVITVSLNLVGTTTGNTTVYAIEQTYASCIVSYNDTDTSGIDGSLAEYGNPLR